MRPMRSWESPKSTKTVITTAKAATMETKYATRENTITPAPSRTLLADDTPDLCNRSRTTPALGSGWPATNASCRAEFHAAGGFLSVRRHNLVGKALLLGVTLHHLPPWPGARRFGAMI